MPRARFIGGPWDGMCIDIAKAYEYYEIAEMGVIDPWVPTEGGGEFVRPRTLRYTLYDSWPVKYLFDKAWGGPDEEAAQG